MIREALGRLFFLVPKTPQTVQVGVTNRCNFNCPMCQRFDLKVAIKDMDFDLYKKILERLPTPGVKNIILTSWGEPLVHSNFIEMVKLAKARGFRVRFTSNGDLLTPEIAQALVTAGLDAVTFSIDQIENTDNNGGHAIKSQLNNILYLKKIITNSKASTQIYIQTVYQTGHEDAITEVARFARDNKLDKVRLSRLDVRFHDWPRPTFNDEKTLIKRLEKVLRGSATGLDFLPHTAGSGLFKILYRVFYPLLHRGGRYCLRTYADVYITEDGHVTPCCALPHLALGNIIDTDLETIWNSDKFQHFREHQAVFCGKCDILKIKPFNK